MNKNKAKARPWMDGWMMAVVILGVEAEPVDWMVFLLTGFDGFCFIFRKHTDMFRDSSPPDLYISGL